MSLKSFITLFRIIFMSQTTKFIILAAGEGVSSFSQSKQLPKCLIPIDEENLLDKSLHMCQALDITEINLIGGFEILKIMKQYPFLKYFYNEKWQTTNNLYSLSKALEGDLSSDIIISYSDIVHHYETVEKLISKDKIGVVYDSMWQDRYDNRDEKEIEKIFYEQEQVRFSKDNQSHEIVGEFAGILYVPLSQVTLLKKQVISLLSQNINSTILDLLNSLSINREIECIDSKGNWAEFDSIQDIEHFVFGTKAETLNSLQLKVQKSKVLEQITFNVEEYLLGKETVVSTIQKSMRANLLVVRSSALNEDTHESSMAGNYESILKVKKDDNDILIDAIEKVMISYTKNNQEQNNKNQILVQPYLENVSMSGVAFTKNLQTSSPYYMINYDLGSDTESVTSGNGSDLNTFICYRDYNSIIEDSRLEQLIVAIKELEKITNYDAIDVEFAFVEEELYILQVRPIAAGKDSIKVLDEDIDVEVRGIKAFLNRQKQKHPLLLGSEIAYGVMPDWNPAEIIGINPKPLAFDLYRYLITDTVWAESRKVLGYSDVENSVGIVSFAGKPYVDIRMSFNTFIPQSLSKEIREKLVDYFILKLKKEPQNHDKVEFNIAITAFDFNFNEKMDELLINGFSNQEVELIVIAYKALTENIISQKDISIASELSNAKILEEKRNSILESNLSLYDKIYTLLEECKRYGTLNFSNLARFGFIGSIFLKSLLAKDAISKEEYNQFFTSIHTVSKSFMDDFESLIALALTKEEFLLKYGHLRPGTYDITSKSYAQNFDGYIDLNAPIVKKNELSAYSFSNDIKSKIQAEIEIYNLSFTVDELILFIQEATEAREKSKFEFTKNLSLVLDLIGELGERFDLNVEELAFVNLNTILHYSNSSSQIDLSFALKRNIESNKKKYLLSSAIQLPELIFSERDIDMFYYSSLKPNFVSNHALVSDIIHLTNSEQVDISNKIVLIENADPGFDWIFSHNIKGLITKYGGAASHMAIRCAEFDLPAAIGCGDKIFNETLRCNKILLDCANHKVEAIS